MSLRACRECGKQISTDARVCPNCGKRIGHGLGAELNKSTTVGCLAVTAGLVVLMFIFVFLEERSTDSTSKQEAARVKAEQVLPPKQTLAEARKELEYGQPGRVGDMVRPLLTNPKYRTQAKRLLNRSMFKMKDQMAAGMQNSMFDGGEEVYVKATGPNKETIEFPVPSWVLYGCTSLQSGSPEVPAKLKGMGFRRVSFVNSITSEAWSQKLE